MKLALPLCEMMLQRVNLMIDTSAVPSGGLLITLLQQHTRGGATMRRTELGDEKVFDSLMAYSPGHLSFFPSLQSDTRCSHLSSISTCNAQRPSLKASAYLSPHSFCSLIGSRSTPEMEKVDDKSPGELCPDSLIEQTADYFND